MLPISHQDNLPTLAAIALLAYTSADVAHHAVGHGAACLAVGGRIELLSSVFVQCTCTGATIDLAGPAANLLLGAGALGGIYFVRRMAPSTQLFWVLTAAFNLLYFAGQLLFSAATMTDDWAWPLHYFGAGKIVRYGLAGIGLAVYVLTVRLLTVQLAPFAFPQSRATTLVYVAWAMAGLIACLTAAFDRHPIGAIFYHAIPQSLLLSLGLLFVPAAASRRASVVATTAPLTFSPSWTAVAAVAGIASLFFLGPGISIL